MLISLLFSQPLAFILIAVILVMTLSIHEFAHAWVADKLGDPTPRYQGRVTLNPLAHLDPLGTLAIFAVGFGWGKPVMFDPYNLRHPVADTAKIALAGPASNLIMAIICSLLLKTFGGALLSVILQTAIYLNVMLAIFNLVPVHPLDGSKIITALLPRSTAVEYQQVMRQYGSWLLLFLILPINGTSAVSQLISPIIRFITNLLT